MVPADSRRIPRAPRYSGTQQRALSFRLQAYHLLWGIIPNPSTKSALSYLLALKPVGPYNPRLTAGLGSSAFAHRYLRNKLSFSFPRLTEMFQFGRLPPFVLWIQTKVFRSNRKGLLHSEISGWAVIGTYPELIAANYVLLRPKRPRHPLDASSRSFHEPQNFSSKRNLLR